MDGAVEPSNLEKQAAAEGMQSLLHRTADDATPSSSRSVVLGRSDENGLNQQGDLGAHIAPEQEDNGETTESQLSEETNSFFVTAPARSAPFLLACAVSIFKIAVFSLAFGSVSDEEPVVATDFYVAAAQVVAIFIGSLTQDDVTDGVKLFHEGYGAVESHFTTNKQPGQKSYVRMWKWALAICAHAAEGTMGLMVTYLFIVRSSTVLDTFLNFAAVEFVALLDNAFFELSQHGFLGPRCMSEAIKIKDEKFEVSGQGLFSHCLKAFLRFSIFLIMLALWIKLVVDQQSGRRLPPNMIVQFGDQTLPYLSAYSGAYVVVQSDSVFHTNRFLWRNERYKQGPNSANGFGTFGYCSGLQRWTFSFQNEDDPCRNAIVVSSEAAKYDFWQTETLSWFVRAGGTLSLLESFSISPSCDDLEATVEEEQGDQNDVTVNQCRAGVCSANTCDCAGSGGIGERCQWDVNAICTTLVVDERHGKLPASRELATVFELLRAEPSNETFLIYDHPVYIGNTTFHDGFDVLLYTGLRWTIVSSFDGFIDKNLTKKIDISQFLQHPDFHAVRSIEKVDLVTTPVRIDSAEDRSAPLELNWVKPADRADFQSLKLDTSSNGRENLICSICTGPEGTNPCLHTGVCSADGSCRCNDGERGARCQKLPLGDGNCNPTFNDAEFRYDNGDCCQSTCESSEFECGLASFSVGGITHSFRSGFPYCLDASVLGTCRGVVEDYGAGCWISGCVDDNCWFNQAGGFFEGLGIFQPDAEQVLLSQNGRFAVVLENEGTELRMSSLHLFEAEESKYVHIQTSNSSIATGLVATDEDHVSVYKLLHDPLAKAYVYQYEKFSSNSKVAEVSNVTIASADRVICMDQGAELAVANGARAQQSLLYASSNLLSLRLPRGICRRGIFEGKPVGQSISHVSSWVGSGNKGVVFAQSRENGDGALATSSDAFLYLPVTKTYSDDGALVNIDFESPERRKVNTCQGIEALAFLNEGPIIKRLHVLCAMGSGKLQLFRYDVNFDKATLVAEIQFENASVAQFSDDGSTLVFNQGYRLSVYSELTKWEPRFVNPVISAENPIERFAVSGDGSTIVVTSSSFAPQVFRVIPLRCENSETPLELVINVKILFYDVHIPVNPSIRWFIDVEDDDDRDARSDVGTMDFARGSASEDEARLCLSGDSQFTLMRVQSLDPCTRGTENQLETCKVLPRQSRFSYAITLNGLRCCSGFVDGFDEQTCDFSRCTRGPPISPPSAAPSLSAPPTREPDPTPPPTRSPSGLPSSSPSLAPTPEPTTPAPTLWPTESLRPSMRGATPLPTKRPTASPSTSPTPLPSRAPTPVPSQSPTPAPTPEPLVSDKIECNWPNLSGCGEDFEWEQSEQGQLGGTISTTIGLYTQLKSLTLNVNGLSGTLPSEIGQLTKLAVLKLYGNKLRGTIPTEIGRLTRLRQLWLDNNQFSGPIPTEFSRLINVRRLDLQYNQLTGTVPTELAGLSGLRRIQLHGNLLTGIVPLRLCNSIPGRVYVDCHRVLCQPDCCRGNFGNKLC